VCIGVPGRLVGNRLRSSIAEEQHVRHGPVRLDHRLRPALVPIIVVGVLGTFLTAAAGGV
jgi:hypothetical protein